MFGASESDASPRRHRWIGARPMTPFVGPATGVFGRPRPSGAPCARRRRVPSRLPAPSKRRRGSRGRRKAPHCRPRLDSLGAQREAAEALRHDAFEQGCGEGGADAERDDAADERRRRGERASRKLAPPLRAPARRWAWRPERRRRPVRAPRSADRARSPSGRRRGPAPRWPSSPYSRAGGSSPARGRAAPWRGRRSPGLRGR